MTNHRIVVARRALEQAAFAALALTAALSLPAPAFAQMPSDLNPPPPDTGGISPAQRLFGAGGLGAGGDAGGGGQGGQGGGAAAGVTSGRGHGTAVLDDEGVTEDDTPSGTPSDIPEIHVVRKGETLWEISNGYFHNPWYWPKLWSFNPLITNPHWIYPGDQVRLYPPGQRQPEVVAAANITADPGEAPRSTVPGRGPSGPSGTSLRQNGFVEKGDFDTSGEIVGSKEEKLLLSGFDEAYVEFKKQRPLKAGERYTVYRTLDEVRHPTTNALLGSTVEILGEIDVRSVNDQRIARGVIVDSVGPIERGDRVGPLRRTFKVVQATPNRANIEGTIVATLRPSYIVGGADALVFIDRGREDKVEVGNRLVVIRRGDGYQPIVGAPNEDPRFPREVVAELLVVDVRAKTSSAFITRAAKEIRIGDRIEGRKGY